MLLSSLPEHAKNSKKHDEVEQDDSVLNQSFSVTNVNPS